MGASSLGTRLARRARDAWAVDRNREVLVTTDPRTRVHACSRVADERLNYIDLQLAHNVRFRAEERAGRTGARIAGTLGGLGMVVSLYDITMLTGLLR